jgi:uncharacterized protein affecting Mg2+/Co2+ transport
LTSFTTTRNNNKKLNCIYKIFKKTNMNKTLQHKLGVGFLFILIICLGNKLHAQTAVSMTMQNVIQTAPNIFEYDVMLTNTGTTTVALRGYSWGINHASGLANGGTISHTFLSRDAALAGLPIPTISYVASSFHLRGTTTTAAVNNAYVLSAGIPVRLATMRVTSTSNFPSNFNPAFNMQTTVVVGKTQCVATCIVTPPGSTYAIKSPGNNPVAGTLQVLTSAVNAPCFILNALPNLSTATACDSYTWSLNGNSYTSSGVYTATSLNGSGCVDSNILTLTIKNSTSNNISASAYASYTWPLTGQTYTTSGVYTHTALNSVGCDSVTLLNLSILQAAVVMTLQNAVQTAPNVFEYDVMLTNTGTTALALRGYSWGVNHASGMANGGTITHSYLSREASLSTLPVPTFSYTAASFHLRGTTTIASIGNEVLLAAGVPVRLATMRVSNTVNFPSNFLPNLSFQTITVPGKTQCVATCIVTPPGGTFAMNGAGNNPVNGTLQVLTGEVKTPCFYLNNTNLFTASNTSTSSAICFGQSSGTAQISLAGNGSAAPSGNAGTFTINGGASISYTGNPFSVNNLSAGTNIILVTTSTGCSDTAVVEIMQQGPITGSSALSACDSYTWNGITYTMSGTPTHTYTAASGCDSVHTLNLIINLSNAGSSNLTACNSYVWNGITYILSGAPTHTYINANGCDSIHTLNLTIEQSSSSTTNVTVINNYTWPANNTTYTASGVYTATLVNAVGCDSNLTLNLFILKVNVGADQNVSCFGSNDGTILASASGGSGSFTYDLDGANLFTNVTGYFFNLTPGIHTVCAKESVSNMIVCDTVTITEPSPLSATFVIDSAIICNGNNGQLSLNISGGVANNQPYLTLWTNSNGDTLNDQGTNLYATTLSDLSADTYHVRIEDDNACVLNVSQILVAGSCNSTLNLKLFIEGYYSGSSAMTSVLLNQGVSLNSTITDSVLIELHDAISPYGLIASTNALLGTNGVANCIFPTLTGSYFIVVKHRNALETWSAAPVLIGTSTTYDFTTSSAQAYGSNMIEVETGIWGFYSGDLNFDENIDLLDLSILEADISNFSFGYYASDINGDGNVDLLDSPVMEENINSFVFAAHP